MFWDNFYKLCAKHNTTPNAVCKELGLSSAAATHWKNGSEPRMPILEKIAKKFNTTPSALLFDTIDVDIYESEKEPSWKTPLPEQKIGIDLGNAHAGIVSKKSLPIKTTRSEMFKILGELSDSDIEKLIQLAETLGKLDETKKEQLIEFSEFLQPKR